MDNTQLNCPACHSTNMVDADNHLYCNACGKQFLVTDGVVDLRIDPSYDTLLDVKNYDKEHAINTKSSINLYRAYNDIFKNHGVNISGKILEIASGSGHLTYGLVSESPFSEIHCSDLSPEFMKILRNRIRSINSGDSYETSEQYYYLFDANYLPFCDKYFDVVVGNSVLHHFAHFEETLANSYRILRTGGMAVFGEPILDTHVFVSIAASLIIAIEQNHRGRNFSDIENRILGAIENRAASKRRNLISDRSSLDTIEDKFQFPIKFMNDLAIKLGFRQFYCSGHQDKIDLPAQIKSAIVKAFKQQNVDHSKLDSYDYVFDSIGLTFQQSMEEETKPLFGFFVFVK